MSFSLNRAIRGLLIMLLAGLAATCRPAGAPASGADYGALPAFTDEGINVVVEIPAGANRKIEYRPASGTFEADRIDGRERIIRFLPYPGNYGFIPSTYMDPARGGDGDALDVLLLSESLPTGSVVAAVPIAALRLRDEGAIDTKIIAVPADPARRIIDVTTFRDFFVGQDAARRIVEDWFLHYEGLGVTELIGWEDEYRAREEIRRWTK